jgi:hypothetical protein
MTRVVVSGYMLRHPVAGNILAFFQYVLGLHRLGHEVVYVEESGWPYSCYDPVTRHWADHPDVGLRVVRDLLASHDLPVPVYYVNRDSGQVDGGDRAGLERALRAADLLLNVGGVCWLPEFRLCRRRALVDMDPLFTQVERFGAEVLADYDVHFSYGVNIGRPGCTIPTGGVDWLPTVPPVVPGLWDGAEPAADAPFTTVGNWGSYGGVEYDGERFGQKDEEFLRVLDLPSRTAQPLELALSGAGAEVFARLRAAGWSVRDAGEEVSTDVATYRAYLRRSRGEFSVAKHAYVKTRSGWFSDRSVCYLAAGLPVVLQDTGFTDWLPAGEGVVAFRTVGEAAAALERVARDYGRHRATAREVARRVFGHDVVLPRLLDLALGDRVAAAPGAALGGGA